MIDRRPGYSNKMMLEYYERLYRVMTKPIDKKKKTNHLSDNGDIMKSIIANIEHYKNAKEEFVSEVCEMPSASFSFRDYQRDIIQQGLFILNNYGMLYLAMEVRTGKTLTALGIASEMKPSDVLFVTKKKAISTIEKDYNTLAPSFYIRVINYESLHLHSDEKKWDIVILDEAHGLGAFPKPSNRAKDVAEIVYNNKAYVILLSGTPTPESYSQMYHQVYGIPTNPFKGYKNFYRFADDYVKVKKKMINGMPANDYSGGLPKILEAMAPYMITYTQSEAGFASVIEEEILHVPLAEKTYKIIDTLKKNLVVEGSSEVILGDTPAKLMNKMHQLYSGTIKFESGKSMVIDDSKARFIKEYFDGSKIAIFYKFKEELNALKAIYGDDLTTELSVFEETDKVIALQIVSGREGISLKHADYLVYYNIDFSATSYWQSRDRMTTKERTFNKVYWVFSMHETHGVGIEHDVYEAVNDKKDYTLNIFKKKYEI